MYMYCTCSYTCSTHFDELCDEIGILDVVLVTDEQDHQGDDVHKPRVL